MSKLVKLYEDMFSLFGVSIADDGTLQLLYDYETNDHINYLIDNKPLVLPTQQVLKKPNWEEYAAFHPLSESATRGESEVQQSLRRAARFKIRAILSTLLVTIPHVLIEDAKKSKSHLTTEIVEKTHKLEGVSKTTLKLITSVLGVSDTNERAQDQTVVRILTQIGGSLEGTKYSRICRIYFPLYEALVDAVKLGHAEVWGIKGTKKDIKLFRDIFEVILGNADARASDLYSSGTNVNTCPYYQSLFDALVKVYTETNYMVGIFSDYIEEPIRSNVHADLKFIDGMPTFRDVRKEVPGLEYNIGVLSDGEEDDSDSKERPRRDRERDRDRNERDRERRESKREAESDRKSEEKSDTTVTRKHDNINLNGTNVRKRLDIDDDEIREYKKSGRSSRRPWEDEDDEDDRPRRRSLRDRVEEDDRPRGRGGDRFSSRRPSLRDSMEREERGRGRGRGRDRDDDYYDDRDRRYSSRDRNDRYSSRRSSSSRGSRW